MVLRVSFCKETEIPHFCELAQMLKPACSDTLDNDILLYVVTGLLGVIPLTGILFSYSRIIYSIMGTSSAVGQHKVFSTCGSHLSVTSLFSGVPHFWNSPFLQKEFSSLGDIHGGSPHAESLHLQSEERAHEGSSEIFQQRSLLSVRSWKLRTTESQSADN